MFFLLSYLIGMCYSVTVQSHADFECFSDFGSAEKSEGIMGSNAKGKVQRIRVIVIEGGCDEGINLFESVR